jgi:hypothetical protein
MNGFIVHERGSTMRERNIITVLILLHQDNKPWGVVFNGNNDIGPMSHDEQAPAPPPS